MFHNIRPTRGKSLIATTFFFHLLCKFSWDTLIKWHLSSLADVPHHKAKQKQIPNHDELSWRHTQRRPYHCFANSHETLSLSDFFLLLQMFHNIRQSRSKFLITTTFLDVTLYVGLFICFVKISWDTIFKWYLSLQMFHNIRQSRSKFLITTTFPDVTLNDDLHYAADKAVNRG